MILSSYFTSQLRKGKLCDTQQKKQFARATEKFSVSTQIDDAVNHLRTTRFQEMHLT